jgi:hypothetical protein
MPYTSYQTINSLDEASFIAGGEFLFEFTVYESDGINPLDLGGASVEWVLCPYGQSEYTALQKTATITGTNTFEVSLSSSDTINLSGKFIHQPIITAFSGEEFRPAQGTVLIIPAIIAS